MPRTGRNPSTDELLIISIASISGLFIVILSIHLLYHLFFKLGSMNKLMKILCVIFSVAYIPMTISNILTETQPEKDRRMWLIIMNASYDAINVSLYLIIYYRFSHTFYHTMYQPPKSVDMFIFSLITLYFFSYTSWFIAYSDYIYHTSRNSSLQIIIISEAAMLIIDIILSATITYLFCKNLFKLTVSMSGLSSIENKKLIPIKKDNISPHILPQQSHRNDISPRLLGQTSPYVTTPHRDIDEEEEIDITLTEATDTNYNFDEISECGDKITPILKSKRSNSILSLSIKTSLLLTASGYYAKDTTNGNEYNNKKQSYTSTLDNKQTQLIAIATRLLILTIPAILTTTLVWSISLIAWISYYHNNKPLYNATRYVLHVFILPIDGVSNFLCVYLNFKFSRKFYNRLCCGINRFCENCWAIVTELKLEQMRKTNL